ncbi:MAG: DUF6462 family protein [Lachnospiraceae bacterium]|nr:DUF6462 family protein [Lachnospiraceae bacterium]
MYQPPSPEKYALTVEQAADYFSIGHKKVRQIADEHPDAGFILYNGTKLLIKCRKFEQFLDQTSSI